MRYLHSLPRWILGLIFFVFGLNKFFHFLPMPTNMPEAASKFAGALFASGYFFQVLATTEVVAGALLLINKWVPLALVVLAPVTLNIFFFHFFLTPGQLLLPLAMILIHFYLGFQYRGVFRHLFQ
jgi:putative oxidoreductase